MEPLVLERTCPHVQLVDGNNFLLQRFHQQGGGLVVRNILDDIQRCIQPPIFIFDGQNGNLRRRNLFPGYKIRTEADMRLKGLSYPTLDLFRKLIAFTKAIVIRVPNWEADDVIATVAKSRSALGEKVSIVSTDRDLSQLAVDPNIACQHMLEGVPPEKVRLYKTVVGDKSDKITGIFRYGDKSWPYLNYARFESILRGGVGSPTFAAYSAEDLGLRPSHYEWVVNNQALLQCYWEITGLMDVDMGDIIPCMSVGSSEMHKADAILRSYML